uniref:Uncharacterized protein n=2 Tax=Physcomitrium patens TaxID=3218 RepID=A0A2K1IH33_PHYPA|nr:hypothetical protein PHYPA_029179 [Physcomitrium patens]
MGSDIRRILTNWKLITLLNMEYKIYDKALQLRLKTIFINIICPNQSFFLPWQFILDKLVLMKETIA